MGGGGVEREVLWEGRGGEGEVLWVEREVIWWRGGGVVGGEGGVMGG